MYMTLFYLCECKTAESHPGTLSSQAKDSEKEICTVDKRKVESDIYENVQQKAYGCFIAEANYVQFTVL